MKHTPGPWTLGTHNLSPSTYAILKVRGSGRIVCIATPGKLTSHGREGEANARLIAQAPSMLEALRDCTLQMAQSNTRTFPEFEGALNNARAILRAIEGE